MKPSILWLSIFLPVTIVLEYVGTAPAPMLFASAEVGSVIALARKNYMDLSVNVSGDGQSNWFKGVQLIPIYLIFALMFYFVPVGQR